MLQALSFRWALTLSATLHLAALSWTIATATPPPAQEPRAQMTFVDLISEPVPALLPSTPAPPPNVTAAPEMPSSAAPIKSSIDIPDISTAPPELLDKPYRQAPPAPSAQEWAAAASYTLKNSKRYRYTWGQQVRSMMGTAFDGPDQGTVRFRVFIAPDGRLEELQTLWTTSPVAERLARQAIERMPPLPPTPNGQPLIFTKTINFDPHTVDMAPLYSDDCLPDPPPVRNRFVWDGKSAQGVAEPPIVETPDPEAYAECLQQLPQDSPDAVFAHDQLELDRWGSRKLQP